MHNNPLFIRKLRLPAHNFSVVAMLTSSWSVKRFYKARRGAAAVEFALTGLALLAFILAILNLGLIGFSLDGLARSVQATARSAAMQASSSYNKTGTMTCPAMSTITTLFNHYADPPLPPAGTAAGSNPLITAIWTNNNAGTGTNELPGVYLTLTVKYLWRPTGFAAFGKGIPLSITTAATVMGSDTKSITISPTCQS